MMLFSMSQIIPFEHFSSRQINKLRTDINQLELGRYHNFFDTLRYSILYIFIAKVCIS